MITSHYDWEERQHMQQVRRGVSAMTAPTVRDAADLAEIYNYETR